MERVKKWLKMLRFWDSSATKDKLRKRVFKGVPNSLRGQVWSRMLNLPTVREEQSGKYQVRGQTTPRLTNNLALSRNTRLTQFVNGTNDHYFSW
jgi:hypothetical protein